MNVELDDVLTITEINKNVSRYISEAANGRTIVVIKNGQPCAAIVGMDVAKRLAHLSEAEEDLRLWTLALVRSATDSGERYGLDDIAHEFGVDLTEE
jgi:antitoxin (DNA-binding transcriptional repressor) of toxin-antitoxin stability system